jgi:hypothetical protein
MPPSIFYPPCKKTGNFSVFPFCIIPVSVYLVKEKPLYTRRGTAKQEKHFASQILFHYP